VPVTGQEVGHPEQLRAADGGEFAELLEIGTHDHPSVGNSLSEE
jgi:hypothetical protein